MTLFQILPILVYGAAIVTIFAAAACTGHARPGLWRLPAIAGAAFALFTLVTILQEGLVGFWLNHTTTWSGNQVWFDLLLAVAIAFALIVPRARAVGMNPWPWAVATVATACVALLPMLARLLWLEERRGANRDGR
jgi:hypothetical protein